MPIIQGSSRTLDLFQDVGRLRRPDERLGRTVVLVDVVSHRGDQFLDIPEDSAAKALLGQISEEPLDHVQPRTAGGREVDMKPRVASDPALHLRVLVGGVVIGDEVDFLRWGRDVIDDA